MKLMPGRRKYLKEMLNCQNIKTSKMNSSTMKAKSTTSKYKMKESMGF